MIASFFNDGTENQTSANTSTNNTSVYRKIVVSPATVLGSEEESSDYDDEARDLLV